MSSVAVRCVFTKFDSFSPRSLTYSCRIKNEKFDFDPIPELIIEKEPTEVEIKPEVPEDNMPPELRALMELSDSSIKKVFEKKIKYSLLEFSF